MDSDLATVIVVTHNRAPVLSATLRSLAKLDFRGSWEVLVVDNNSTDCTRQTVEDARATFPVPLRYHFEGRAGKYWALNGGIRMADVESPTGDVFGLIENPNFVAAPPPASYAGPGR